MSSNDSLSTFLNVLRIHPVIWVLCVVMLAICTGQVSWCEPPFHTLNLTLVSYFLLVRWFPILFQYWAISRVPGILLHWTYCPIIYVILVLRQFYYALWIPNSLIYFAHSTADGMLERATKYSNMPICNILWDALTIRVLVDWAPLAITVSHLPSDTYAAILPLSVYTKVWQLVTYPP